MQFASNTSCDGHFDQRNVIFDPCVCMDHFGVHTRYSCAWYVKGEAHRIQLDDDAVPLSVPRKMSEHLKGLRQFDEYVDIV